MASRHLRLGTRRSALARAQSGLIARELERLHPGLTVELIGIDTRGDRILDQPLSQVDGKEFFTAEIDSALLRGDVDFTVHSFKDLSLERPAALCLGAVPRRENPRDIALFAADVPARLAQGLPLRVGTSSPRRRAFVPDFLQRALPGDASTKADNARVQLCEVRGNVDSRLRRLHEQRGSARQLDGVVLALAGLVRLWQDGAGRVLLGELLQDLPRMLLPLTACPAAPAQGALAIECRTDDLGTRELLQAIDDVDTRRAVAAERQLLAQRGGGCHQKFGATQVAVPGLGALLHVREALETGGAHTELKWQPEVPLPAAGAVTAIWDGSQQAAAPLLRTPEAAASGAAALARASAAFIAHRRALPDYDSVLNAGVVNHCEHIWVPGTETWFALAERGVWVEGCAEGLGFETLQATLAEPVLQLPPLGSWVVLTHEAAAAGWIGESHPTVLATYRHAPQVATDDSSPLHASHIYWHSAAQFERWAGSGRAKFASQVHHACAFGKTAGRLRNAGIANLAVFPSVREWREWLQA